MTRTLKLSALAVGALLVLGAPKAFSAEPRHHKHHSRHADAACKASSRWIAQKITSFKPGDPKSEARHFDFQNYSFVTLDDAARRLFPSGTKLSYVDRVLRGRGKALKSTTAQSVRYDYRFRFDRFDCTRTVSVSFDGKTKRVTSAEGNGRCN